MHIDSPRNVFRISYLVLQSHAQKHMHTNSQGMSLGSHIYEVTKSHSTHPQNMHTNPEKRNVSRALWYSWSDDHP
jgi:hypothetical protein